MELARYIFTSGHYIYSYPFKLMENWLLFNEKL